MWTDLNGNRVFIDRLWVHLNGNQVVELFLYDTVEYDKKKVHYHNMLIGLSDILWRVENL